MAKMKRSLRLISLKMSYRTWRGREKKNEKKRESKESVRRILMEALIIAAHTLDTRASGVLFKYL